MDQESKIDRQRICFNMSSILLFLDTAQSSPSPPSDKNKDKYKDSLQPINWEQELCNKNTNQAISYFYEQLTQTYNKSFPLMKLSTERGNDKPWINKSLRKQYQKQTFIVSVISP